MAFRYLERLIDQRIHRYTANTKLTEQHTEQHYQQLFERAQAEADRNQAWLFSAWRTMWGQTKGLQRQRRIINRLRAKIADLEAQLRLKAPPHDA